MIASRLFRKTLLVVTGIFVFIVAASSLFSLQILRQQMIDEYLSKAQSIVASISMSVPETFLERDAATIQSIIDQYLQVEGVAYVFVHDNTGSIIAHTFSPEIPDDLDVYHSLEDEGQDLKYKWINLEGTSFLDVYGSILLGRGGIIHIGMDKSLIDQKITATLLKIQAFNLGIFILCILIIYQFMKRISQPLVKLTDYARRLRNKDLDFSIEVDSRDEIGELAGTMDGMRLELSGYVHKLQESVRNATEELQQTLTYLSSIMDNIADGLLVLDEEGRIIRYNISFKKMFFIDRHNLIEEKASDLIQRDLIRFFHSHSTNDYQRLEFSFESPDKEKVFLEATISLVTMSCGVSYIVIFHDITTRKNMENELKSLYADLEKKVRERTSDLVQANENLNQEIALRKQTETELQSEKEFFAVTLKSIGDAVLTTDKDGQLVFINRKAEEILGVKL